MKRIRFIATIMCVLVISMTVGIAGAVADPGKIDEASLKSGDYSNGKTVAKLYPWGEVPPATIGIIDSPDGITFTAPEAIINWQLTTAQQSAFRSHGTVSFMFKADRETHTNGEIFGDNYGFDQYHNGQGTFAMMAHRDDNSTPDKSDDKLNIKWKTWHNYAWIYRDTVTIEYDRWYHLGIAWGDSAETDSGDNYEVWVCGDCAASDSEGDLPWGTDWMGLGSAFNIGLGGHHERGWTPTSYGSATGVMFFDIRIWDSYQSQGDTLPCGETQSYAITATPAYSINPIMTDHTVTATVTIQDSEPTEYAEDVAVCLKVISGPNVETKVCDTTDEYGEVGLTYLGDGGSGSDIIHVWADANGNGELDDGESFADLEKVWIENFVTGGGKINSTEGKGKKAAFSFAGTVGVAEGQGIVGQFQMVDHISEKTVSWHCNNDFEHLRFEGNPAESPQASHDTAIFLAHFTNNRDDNGMSLWIKIVDNGEGKKATPDEIGASLNGVDFEMQPIDGGNFQVHNLLPYE